MRSPLISGEDAEPHPRGGPRVGAAMRSPLISGEDRTAPKPRLISGEDGRYANRRAEMWWPQ